MNKNSKNIPERGPELRFNKFSLNEKNTGQKWLGKGFKT